MKKFISAMIVLLLVCYGLMSINTSMQPAAKAQVVGDVVPWKATVRPGEIILMRGNTIVSTYGGPGLTSAVLGDQLTTALAALQNDDMLITGPGLYECTEVSFSESDITWKAYGTTIIPDTDDVSYSFILRVATGADGSVIEGLRIWDKDSVGTGTDNTTGLQVQASNVTLRNCVVDGMWGTGLQSGVGFGIFGEDNTLVDCIAQNTGYAGLLGSCNRMTVDGLLCLNCGVLNGSPNTRSVNVQGSTAYEWMKFLNCQFVAKVTDSSALVNINHSNSMEHLIFDNCTWVDEDQVSSGVSFNTASREQQLKFQRCDKIDISNCVFRHGTNSGAGYVVAVSADSPYPTEINFLNCSFSDSCLIDYTSRFEKVTYRRCHFGVDDNGEQNGLVGLMAGRFEFDDCTFNLGTTLGVAFYALNIATVTGDQLTIKNCEFTANQSGDVAMIGTGGYISSNARPIIAYNNKLTNSGAGNFVKTTDQDVNLLLSTDPNGDMLYDSTDSNMPSPGAGPNFFTSPAVPGFAGQKIWDVGWSGGVQYYWHNGTNWVTGAF